MSFSDYKTSPTHSDKLSLLREISFVTVLIHTGERLVSGLEMFGNVVENIFNRLIGLIQHATGLLTIRTRPFFLSLSDRIMAVNRKVKSLGVEGNIHDVFRRRLGLLNQINLLHLVTNIIIPVVVFVSGHSITPQSFLLSLAPSLVSVLVLVLNARRRYNTALLAYFILYPFFTCLIYLGGMNLGMELYFILYGILAVFFLQNLGHIIFAVGFSMVSYFVLTVLLEDYSISLQAANPVFYIFNQLVAILFIFYGLLLIKKENTDYQSHILFQNKEISDKAELLEQQTSQLSALNSVKTRLFSIISHDLRAPVYALKEVFKNAQQHKLSHEELQQLIPEVVKDLNKTTGLMESVLEWAKNQFKAESIKTEPIDISRLLKEAIAPFMFQMDSKQIRLTKKLEKQLIVMADWDTVNSIVRNFLSNAIKFTPEGGAILIEAGKKERFITITVRDSGKGISRENIEKIFNGEHFSTAGTNEEKGSGLGLLLCRDFIIRNGGEMSVESVPGQGSSFSFTLPSR